MRTFFKIVFAIAALAASFGVAGSARALTLHQGESITLNADFTNASPPPPYLGAVELEFVFSGGDPGEQFAADLFGDLNATGTYFGTINNIVGTVGKITTFSSEALDGIYSIRLTAEIGDFNVDEVWFQ